MRIVPRQQRWYAFGQVALLSMGTLILINTVDLGQTSLLAQDFQNFGHVIVFALLGIGVHRAVEHEAEDGSSRLRQHMLSGTLLASLGLLSEVLQVGSTRTASLSDLLRNLAGAYFGLVLWDLYSQRVRRRISPKRTGFWQRPAAMFVAAIILALTVVPVGRGMVAHLKRNRSFPDLLPKSAIFVNRFVKADSVQLVVDQAVANEAPHLACVFDDKLFPGVILADPFPDWRGYRFLHMRYRLTGWESRTFVLILDPCSPAGSDLAFCYDLRLEKGEHEIVVDLEAPDSTYRPDGWNACVDRIYIKTDDVSSELSLRLYELYLSP